MTTYNLPTKPETMTRKCDTDLSEKIYHFAMFEDTDEGIVNISDGTAIFSVILQEGADGSVAEKEITVAFAGTSFLELGGTVNNGDMIKAHTDGMGVEADTDTDFCQAIALADGVDGDIIPVAITHFTLSV